MPGWPADRVERWPIARTARSIGQENLTKPDIAAAIEAAQRSRSAWTGITANMLIAELAKIGFANMADYMKATPGGDPYLDFAALTRDQAAALQEVTIEDYVDGRGDNPRDVKRVKFRLADKRAALVDLGRHLGMFVSKHQYTGKDGGPIIWQCYPGDENLCWDGKQSAKGCCRRGP